MDITTLKQRYGIIGNDPKLQEGLNKALQVAATDLSILITGESGVGKDIFSRIIHENSQRKKGNLVAVNCGAIPEGTIESELFGHKKGAFTGADRDRKGYFEVASNGTIFLDEVGELPLAMQVKLLRVLENGEIIPVGASEPVKVNVRVVAATNINIAEAVRNGHFREDLYYRLNQITIAIPPLRERKDDVPLLFRTFSSDVAEKYNMPPIFLNEEARSYLMNYPWYGNIRELKNLTEQVAVVETERTITLPILQKYLNYVPEEKLPALVDTQARGSSAVTERELLLKALDVAGMINQMRNEINDLKQVVAQLVQGMPLNSEQMHHVYKEVSPLPSPTSTSGEYTMLSVAAPAPQTPAHASAVNEEFQESVEVVEEDSLALEDREKKAIATALKRHNGKRKPAAQDLHISERTLYRKIKEYDIEL